MRVVQLLPELNEGGVERGVVELNRELVKRGVESIIISAGGTQAQQLEVDGGRHIFFDVVSKNPLTAPLRVLQLRTLLKGLRPDILHARSRVPAWLAYLANKQLQLPFVTTVHGFNSVNRYSRVMTYGQRVICVSNAIQSFIQKHYQVQDAKCVVIPRGVDLELFDPETLDQSFIAEFKMRYQLEGRLVVTAVGRITQLKDYETLIRALVIAKQKVPELVGLIVGGVRADKEAHFRELKSQVAAAGAVDYIHFAGSQSRVAEIYALSNLVVSSSKKPESFGRSAAEALAMGTPVVATGHGGILDIVIEGKTGFLFSAGDAEGLAEKLLATLGRSWPDLRQSVISNFSLEQMVDKTLAVYRELNAHQQLSGSDMRK